MIESLTCMRCKKECVPEGTSLIETILSANLRMYSVCSSLDDLRVKAYTISYRYHQSHIDLCVDCYDHYWSNTRGIVFHRKLPST